MARDGRKPFHLLGHSLECLLSFFVTSLGHLSRLRHGLTKAKESERLSTYRHLLPFSQSENDVQMVSWRLPEQVAYTNTLTCLPESRGTLYSVCKPPISSCASIGRSLVLNPLMRTTLMVISFVCILTKLNAEFSKCISGNKTNTHVLQPIVTFVPFSSLVNSSSVPCSCLMVTRYFVGDCLGRESRIEICVTSTNLQLGS